MPTIPFAENYYSFRNYKATLSTVFEPPSPEHAALHAIEAKLIEAHSLFLARRYQDAIDAYLTVQGLIYAQVSPAFPIGNVFSPSFIFPIIPIEPLLSASLEWMNVLRVRQPTAMVRPRLPVDDALLQVGGQLGVSSQILAAPKAVSTAADLQLARTFSNQGNTSAANFFIQRAQTTDPATAEILNSVLGLSHGETPPAPATRGSAMARESEGNSAPNDISHTDETLNVMASVSHTAPVLEPVPVEIPTTTFHPTPSQAIFSAPIAAAIPLPQSVIETRILSTGLHNRDRSATFDWGAGEAPPLDDIKAAVYERRVGNADLVDLISPALVPSDVALLLPHDYYYVIPLGLAECYHALEDYQKAKTYYFQAASYQYLNPTIEAPYLWLRIATLYLDWGNTFFRAGETADALSKYEQVLMPDDSAPTASQLYTLAALKPGADAARTVIANLQAFINTPSSPSLPTINPVLVATIIEVHQQLVKINAGLDFWGFWAPSVPIWTFDYLQSVAVNFTQLAINAERDFINYQDRADQAALTRQQIVQQVSQAQAEVQAAQLQADAAALEVQVYNDGLALAQQRATDAQTNANDYAAKSWDSISYQASSAQVSGGDDGDPNALNALASQLLSGQTISGSRATIAAATQLAGARANRDYEIGALQRQAAELQSAAQQAQSEQVAASARAAAANAAVAVASLRTTAAQQTLDAFDSQFFTPDVWQRMGDVMYRLYRRYLSMALHTARVMQQAYNFETDQSLHFIKADYSTNEVKGLLAAEALMADIQSFTYDLITSRAGKPQPVRQTISLAENYAYLFEAQLRKTGVMEFETRIDDFDTYYPGTYAGRIEAVEVEVDGIVPVSGISGTLTNSGISSYRIPSSSWPTPSSSGLKYRVQSKETLVLSDYQVRQDALLISSDQRMLRVFQGAGVASSWRLELPKVINDIDYGALTDVRITFYYKARFDPVLHDLVLAQLATHPGVNTRQRAVPLRWFYPDAFFHFQDTGTLSITLKAVDFRRNESQPVLTNIGLLVATDGTVAASGLNVSLATPTHAALLGTTDATGLISSGGASPWTPLGAGTAVGDYAITLAAANNPTLVHDGKLDLTPIVNIVLILEYTFTPRK